MPEKSNIGLPGSHSGLARYSEEYPAIINLKPVHVIGFAIALVLFRIILGIVLKK